ncbi:hypothetical protein PR048_029007 [Dryococelus australis]|uniref:Uncharacterized protein n=1 Tax=Dryococelus australis TaxID=614101 RepID=A0ABQ9GEP5_9NEOP|nr:hypothetical protein PR048_029007 [Dryococelus australis]
MILRNRRYLIKAPEGRTEEISDATNTVNRSGTFDTAGSSKQRETRTVAGNPEKDIHLAGERDASNLLNRLAPPTSSTTVVCFPHYCYILLSHWWQGAAQLALRVVYPE